MENSECGSHGGFPIVEGIPGDSHSGLDVRVILLKERVPGPRSDDRQGDRLPCWNRSRVGEEVGEVRPLFERHAVELIANPQTQRQVWANLPLVLTEPVVFVLPEV